MFGQPQRAPTVTAGNTLTSATKADLGSAPKTSQPRAEEAIALRTLVARLRGIPDQPTRMIYPEAVPEQRGTSTVAEQPFDARPAASFRLPRLSLGSSTGYPSPRPTAAPRSCSLRFSSSSGSPALCRPRASTVTDITASSHRTPSSMPPSRPLVSPKLETPAASTSGSRTHLPRSRPLVAHHRETASSTRLRPTIPPVAARPVRRLRARLLLPVLNCLSRQAEPFGHLHQTIQPTPFSTSHHITPLTPILLPKGRLKFLSLGARTGLEPPGLGRSVTSQ